MSDGNNTNNSNNGNNGNNGNSSSSSGNLSSSASASASASSSPSSEQRRQHKLEEASIISSFSSIISTKFASQTNINRLDKLYQNTEYSSEKALLTKMNNNGLLAGILGGVGSFLFLRRGPKILSGYLVRRAEARGGASGGGGSGGGGSGGASGGGYKFDRRNPFDAAKSHHQQQQQQQQMPSIESATSSSQLAPPPPPPPPPNQRRPGIIIRTIKFFVDVTISSTMALYASAVFTDKQRLLEEASEIPLVQGRSLISDELCADFIRQYGSIDREIWDRHRNSSDALGAIENFVVNCARREVEERRVREERGLRPGGAREGEHVAVPSPGVPRDIDVVLAELGRGGDGDDDDDGDGDDSRQQDSSDDSDGDDGPSFDDNQFDASNFGGDMVDNDETTTDGALGEWSSVDDFDGGSKNKDFDGEEDAPKGNGRKGWGW